MIKWLFKPVYPERPDCGTWFDIVGALFLCVTGVTTILLLRPWQ